MEERDQTQTKAPSGQAGLVLGVVMTFAFAANTMISCLQTAQAFAKYVAQYEIGKIAQLPFPQRRSRIFLCVLLCFGEVIPEDVQIWLVS